MKNMKKLVPVACFAFAAVLFFLGQNVAKADTETEVKISEGVSIAHVDVSGLTAQEAKAQVEAFVAELNQQTFVLKSENGEVEATLEDMAASCDVDTAVKEAVALGHSGNLIRRYKEVEDLKKAPQVINLRLKADNQTTAQYLYSNREDLNLEAVNMGLVREGGAFKTTPGVDGNEVDYVASVPVINEAINAWTPGANTEVNLVCNVVKHKGSEEELATITDVLGTYSTKYGNISNSGRAMNVETGCRNINGHVVYPGEEFSANAAMEPYTVENGYREGGSYENGQVVSSIGGGICQVASTLYNAVIRAELEITFRAAHSMTVTYNDISEDAAIAGDYKDLRFRNNQDTPVYIEGLCVNGDVIFNIYGKETRDPGHKVEFVSETVETIVPDTEFNFSDEYDIGYYQVTRKPYIGYKGRLWKVVYENGTEVSRDIFNRSTYVSSSGATTIGTRGASPEQLAAINAAIEQAKVDKSDAIVESTVAGFAGAAPAATEAAPQAPAPAATETAPQAPAPAEDN